MRSFGRLRPRFQGQMILVGCALFVAGAAAQGAPPSGDADKPIATAAQDSKTQKTGHAKKVFTNDDLDATAMALPPLRMDGADNGDDIVTAITKYKQTHTPEQTEAAVRVWYERYDEMLAAAIQENLDIKTLGEANQTNGYELCRQSGDYEKCEARRQAEFNGAQHDRMTVAKNGTLEVRIQHAFMKIRVKLQQQNLRYEWFKIRTTNWIDIY